MRNGTFNWGKELVKDEDEDDDKKKKKKGEKKPKEKKKKQLEDKKEHSILSSSDAETLDDIVTSQQLKPMKTEEKKEPEENERIIRHINLQIKKGSLVAIIGDVGAGKSSLIYSLIAEMKQKDNPSLNINGKMCLVNQKPWIMNLTVKDNILFGLPYDEFKYKEVLKYSCLESDLEILANGDQTMIGEKGVNLSGGQKARIALARAIYSDCDILLLDDILRKLQNFSAVDIHVGLSIMNDCLRKFKHGTTRILVTHALFYMKYMDYM